MDKTYDLEERTYEFAKQCRDFVKRLPKTSANLEYGRQLIRSSSSQAANYIEANESLGEKDFIYRIKICIKESKESTLWLRLCETANDSDLASEQDRLKQESFELRKIFCSIMKKRK